MGGGGHRWQMKGKWKKAKHKVPVKKGESKESVEKLLHIAAITIGKEKPMPEWDSEKEHAEHLKKKEKSNEEIKEIEEKGEERKAQNKAEEAKKAEFERTRMARAQEIMRNLRPGKVDNGFYGHVHASDFKRTSIITTYGRQK